MKKKRVSVIKDISSCPTPRIGGPRRWDVVVVVIAVVVVELQLTPEDHHHKR